MARLLDIILALGTEDLRCLSAITIERANNGGWQARCNICRDTHQEGPSGVRGVSLIAWERVPDQEYPLDLNDLARDRDMQSQAASLQASGLVGKLDMARFDSADRRTSYLIKTHAGSQAERTKWLMGLRERPENTIWLTDGQRQIP